MKYIDLSAGIGAKLANLPALKYKAEAVAEDLKNEIKKQMEEGAPRTGHEYPMPDTPGTKYTASAPGEPPAVRTGSYVAAWQTSPAVVDGAKVRAAAVNDRKTEDEQHFIGELLEYGTQRTGTTTADGMIVPYVENIAPRPHIRPALDIVAQRWGGVVKGGGQ